MITALHNRCHKPIAFTEVTKGYHAQCPDCDEDVFAFEVEESMITADCLHAYLGERMMGEEYYCLDCGKDVETEED